VPGLATAHRPPPSWLITESYDERRVVLLKSGKEAEVFLVERVSASGACLLAHKRYRPRYPQKGELRALGFSKGTIYRHDRVYHEGWNLPGRVRRAVNQGTAFGHEVMAELWPANEYEMLRRAWRAGASVPYPVERSGDGLLMEYVGDRTEAAPRLVQARLDGDAVASAWAQLTESLRLLLRAGVVHADLSVYNLLWWHGRLVMIDFPQAVDSRTNGAAADLLHRDLMNVATWFDRRGLPVEPEAVFSDLLAEML
jgi:RIO kinase 1